MDFAPKKAAEVVSGKKSFKSVAKSVRRQTLIKHSGSGS